MNVIGVDDGKSVLKMVWNWSTRKADNGKDKLTGLKRSIVLAAVSKVSESHHNMKVLMQLTKINEVDYKLSQDLKLINIMIGIGPHSSRFPCPYGECCKDDKGDWVKGQDRTPRNMREHRKRWMNRSRSKKGNRDNLKEHMNCEHESLIAGNEDDPVYLTAPPPPLHTILLGPVNHILKALQKVHPRIFKRLSELSIQRSKYHGKNPEGIYI
jgi:hypothetical protein